MDYNLNNYLEEVVSPALNPTQYAQGMTDMVETINANFRKIIGLPFIQGDAGESVVITREYIYEAGTNYDAFTDFGKELVKAIYKDYIPDEALTFDTYSELQEYLSINNESAFVESETGYSCSFLAPKTTEDYETGDLIRDDDANYITMQSVGDKKVSDSIYFFIDERTTEEHLETIMGNEEMRQKFEDCSCGIYCLYENGQWTLTRNYMLPRFYWDEDLSMFCWKLNNLKTHVTAQGIKGDDGQRANAYICKGTASVDVNTTPYRIVLDSIWDPTSDPDNPNWAWVTIPDDISLKNSIIGVWFKQQGSNVYDGFVIGVADKEGDDWVMYYQDGEGGINMDFQSIINHFTLKTLLDQVGLRDASTTLNDDNENTPARARGLYIRESINSTDPQLEETAHIFAMSDAILNTTEKHPVLTPIEYQYTNTQQTEKSPLPDPGNLTVNYNTVVQGTAQAQVDGLAGVYLGTPVGTVVMWSGYKDKDGVDTNLNPGGLHEMADGWLLCNGTTITLNSEENLKKYKALYRVIIGQDPSPSFGPGPNPLTFPPLLTLPNFCQRFPLGALGQSTLSGFDTTLRRFGGEPTVTLSQDEMPKHTHEIIQDGEHRHTVESYQIRYSENTGHPSLNDSDNGHYRINADHSRFVTTENGLHSHTIKNAGGDQPHNNIPPFYTINFIIKYK